MCDIHIIEILKGEDRIKNEAVEICAVRMTRIF